MKNKFKVIYLHPHSRKENDLVAQLVEHITFNDGVLGSSPSQVTKVNYFQECIDLVAQLVEHITFNDGVLGSSPSQVTKLKTLPSSVFSILGQVEKR